MQNSSPMHSVPFPNRLTTIVLLIVMTISTFAADRYFSLGTGIWVLYLVPVVLTTQLLPHYTGIALVIGSGLLSAGMIDPKEGLVHETAVADRGLGLIVLVFTGLFLLRHRRTVEALQASEGRYQLLSAQHGLARAEAALQAVQERFKSIFYSSHDAIAYATFDGTLLEVNDAFLRLTGRRQEDLIEVGARVCIAVGRLVAAGRRSAAGAGKPERRFPMKHSTVPMNGRPSI